MSLGVGGLQLYIYLVVAFLFLERGGCSTESGLGLFLQLGSESEEGSMVDIRSTTVANDLV